MSKIIVKGGFLKIIDSFGYKIFYFQISLNSKEDFGLRHEIFRFLKKRKSCNMDLCLTSECFNSNSTCGPLYIKSHSVLVKSLSLNFISSKVKSSKIAIAGSSKSTCPPSQFFDCKNFDKYCRLIHPSKIIDKF